MRFSNARAQAGQSLVQVIVAMALMSIMMLSFAQMMSLQSRETQMLTKKMARMDLEKLLIGSLANGSVCNYILNNPIVTFNSSAVSPTNPQYMTPALPIYASVQTSPSLVLGPLVAQIGQPASSLTPTVKVGSIRLAVTNPPTPMPAPGPGAVFTGYWEVGFQPAGLITSLAPVKVSTSLTVDTTNPAAAKVTACNAPSGGPPIPGTVVGGAWCWPFFFGACVGLFNFWGQMSPLSGCPAGTTVELTGLVQAGPVGMICVVN